VKIGGIKTQHVGMSMSYAGIDSILFDDHGDKSRGGAAASVSSAAKSDIFCGSRPQSSPAHDHADHLSSRMKTSLTLTPQQGNDKGALQTGKPPQTPTTAKADAEAEEEAASQSTFHNVRRYM
jgi:hypothetical protein